MKSFAAVIALTIILGLTVWPAAAAQAGEGVKRIAVHFDNEVTTLDSAAATVGGFVNELSIYLPPDTQVTPPVDAALKDGMHVYIRGLSVTRGTIERTVPQEIEFTENWRYGPEQVALVELGCTGLVRTDYTIFYMNGKEVGRRQRMEVIREMRPKLVVYYHTLNSGDGPSYDEILQMRAKPGTYSSPPARYKYTKTMNSSAYEPGPTSCGRFATGNTSCGLKAGYGVVAVDPKVIPLHTRLYIEGYGYAIAGDVGAAIKGDKIDLGMMTVEECIKWGRRPVQVYVLY